MLSGAGNTNAHTQLEINVILSAWQLVCATAGSLRAEKIGRKWLACLSIGSGAVFLFMFGGLTGKYGTSDNSSGVYGTVACMFLFLGAYSFGLTPLTVIYPPRCSRIVCVAQVWRCSLLRPKSVVLSRYVYSPIIGRASLTFQVLSHSLYSKFHRLEDLHGQCYF
jgi:Sugar (and other) transporter